MLATNQPITVISCADGAIDASAMTDMEMVAYFETRDPSLLRFEPGMKPIEYTLKPLSQPVKAEILKLSKTQEERYLRAFNHSVVMATNVVEPGTSRSFTFTPANERQPLTDEQAGMFPLIHQLDIGGVAWDRAFLDPRSKVRSQAHPLLASHLVRLPYRSAAQSDAEAKNKSEDSANRVSSDHGAAKAVAP